MEYADQGSFAENLALNRDNLTWKKLFQMVFGVYDGKSEAIFNLSYSGKNAGVTANKQLLIISQATQHAGTVSREKDQSLII